MKPQIFTYWEGPEHPYISHCLKTIQEKCGVPVVVIRPETVSKYVGKLLHKNWTKLSQIAQKIDCVRLAVMYQHGGMWCDADTLFLRDCSHLFKEDVDFIGMRWTHNQNMTNGYWFCKKGSKFIKGCLDSANKLLEEGFKDYYDDGTGCYLGEDLFARVESERKYAIETVPLDTFIPVNFPVQPSIWSTYADIADCVSDKTVAIGLNNSQLSEMVKICSVDILAKKRNLLGSAFRYSGVDVQISNASTPIAADLKSMGLPETFGPEHPDWKMPSKRQKYFLVMDALDNKPEEEPVVVEKEEVAIYRHAKASTSQKRRELSKMEFGGSLAIMTVFSGEYQWFAPMFADMIRKNIPDATPLMYCHGKCDLPERFRHEVRRSAYLDSFPVDGYRTAALRFLFSNKDIEKYDYVLITDIDIMFSKEDVSVLDQHVRSMMLWETDCYDNYNHGTDSKLVMPGVHFVSKAWWKKTMAAREREAALLKMKSTGTYDGYDEEMLGRLVIGSGLPAPTSEPQMWNHHGLHLGEYRKNGLNKMSKRGMDANNSITAKQMVSDEFFISITDAVQDNVKGLKKLLDYFRSM